MNANTINSQKTLVTPIWVLAIRIAQVVLSIVILGLAATWSEYALFDGPSLAIAAAVFTWIIVAYTLVTEKVAAANAFYTIYAVMALDAYMVIIWLSTWALNAARRAALGNVGSGSVGSGGHGRYCYDGYCVNYKRGIAPRSITYSTLSGLLAGVAALGAIVWVSFIVTLVWTVMNFLKGRKDGRFTLGSQSTVTADHNMEEQKAQAQQPVQPQYAAQQQPPQQPYAQYPQQPVEGQYQQPQYTHDPNHPAPQQHQ